MSCRIETGEADAASGRHAGDRERQKTRVFSELQSGRPAKGNRKDQASYCTSLGILDASLRVMAAILEPFAGTCETRGQRWFEQQEPGVAGAYDPQYAFASLRRPNALQYLPIAPLSIFHSLDTGSRYTAYKRPNILVALSKGFSARFQVCFKRAVFDFH